MSRRPPRREPVRQPAIDAFGAEPQPVLQGIVKIAVLVPGDLEGFLLTLPALESLQAAYPAAGMTLLGQPWQGQFLKDRPGPIHEVLVLARGSNGLDQRVVGELTSERLDVLLLLHSPDPIIEQLAAAAGARLVAAYTRDGSTAGSVDIALPWDSTQPVSVRHLELVSRLGARPQTLQGRVYLLDADLQAARELVRGGPGKPIVAIDPCGTVHGGWWPGHFAAAADGLAEAGATPVLLGEARDRELLDEITRLTSCSVLRPRPRTVAALAGLLARSAAVLGSPGGALELARCLGTPTITLIPDQHQLATAPLGRARHRVLLTTSRQPSPAEVVQATRAIMRADSTP